MRREGDFRSVRQTRGTNQCSLAHSETLVLFRRLLEQHGVARCDTLLALLAVGYLWQL